MTAMQATVITSAVDCRQAAAPGSLPCLRSGGLPGAEIKGDDGVDAHAETYA